MARTELMQVGIRAVLCALTISAAWGETLRAQPSVANASGSPPATYQVRFAKLGGQFAFAGPAGPYFPEREFRFGTSGVALLQCSLAAKGALDSCSLISQTPPRSGFGDAAILMARKRAITLAPSATGVEVAPGAIVRVEVPFTLPGKP